MSVTFKLQLTQCHCASLSNQYPHRHTLHSHRNSNIGVNNLNLSLLPHLLSLFPEFPPQSSTVGVDHRRHRTCESRGLSRKQSAHTQRRQKAEGKLRFVTFVCICIDCIYCEFVIALGLDQFWSGIIYYVINLLFGVGDWWSHLTDTVIPYWYLNEFSIKWF